MGKKPIKTSDQWGPTLAIKTAKDTRTARTKSEMAASKTLMDDLLVSQGYELKKNRTMKTSSEVSSTPAHKGSLGINLFFCGVYVSVICGRMMRKVSYIFIAIADPMSSARSVKLCID